MENPVQSGSEQHDDVGLKQGFGPGRSDAVRIVIVDHA